VWEETVHRHPNKEAVIFEDKTYTFKQIDDGNVAYSWFICPVKLTLSTLASLSLALSFALSTLVLPLPSVSGLTLHHELFLDRLSLSEANRLVRLFLFFFFFSFEHSFFSFFLSFSFFFLS